MDEIVQVEKSENGIYELGFILVPGITEEKVSEVFGVVKSIASDVGAVVFAEEFPRMTTLSYTMEKTINNKIERFKEGYFGWIKFELASGDISKVDAKMRLREDVIRHIVLSTVKENTIASKRTNTGRRHTKGDEKEKDPSAPEMSKEEIDREIEALVSDKVAAEQVVEKEL